MKNTEKCMAAMKAVLESSMSADDMIEVLEYLIEQRKTEEWREEREGVK